MVPKNHHHHHHHQQHHQKGWHQSDGVHYTHTHHPQITSLRIDSSAGAYFWDNLNVSISISLFFLFPCVSIYMCESNLYLFEYMMVDRITCWFSALCHQVSPYPMHVRFFVVVWPYYYYRIDVDCSNETSQMILFVCVCVFFGLFGKWICLCICVIGDCCIWAPCYCIRIFTYIKVINI